MGAGTFTATASTDGHRRLRYSRGRGNGGEAPAPLRVKTAPSLQDRRHDLPLLAAALMLYRARAHHPAQGLNDTDDQL